MPPGGEEAAEAFYVDLLGLVRVAKPPELAARGGCWFELGAVRLHLGAEEGFRPARKAHPALAVDGLDALLSRLDAAGHRTRRSDTAVGRAQFYVDDPFGNRIELTTPEEGARRR